MVQDVQLHGSRRLVAAAMTSSTSGEDWRRPEWSQRRSCPSMLPRSSETREQPCQESSVEQPAESNARSMDSAAWHRLLRCAGCALVVDPDVARGEYCWKLCHATASVQHGTLCGQEVALAWMTTAAAVLLVEPVEPAFRKASKRAKTSQPSVAGSPTGSAEQLAEPWSIWRAETK